MTHCNRKNEERGMHMKITIFSLKGGSGKTPIAINLAVDKDYALASNESLDAFSGYFDDERLLFIAAEEKFPDLPSDIDVIFDLAGSMTRSDHSTVSAIRQSDVVLVPIWNNRLAIMGGLKSIQSINKLGKKVIVVATKLAPETRKKGQCWTESDDYKAIYSEVSSISEELGYMPAVMPLKFSKVFETVVNNCTSIHTLTSQNGLFKYTYKELLSQIDNLYQEIEKHG